MPRDETKNGFQIERDEHQARAHKENKTVEISLRVFPSDTVHFSYASTAPVPQTEIWRSLNQTFADLGLGSPGPGDTVFSYEGRGCFS